VTAVGNPKGVFFDLYGTLLIFGDLAVAWDEWFGAFYHHIRILGLEESREQFAARADRFFSRPEPEARDDGLTLFERRFSVFCEELGLSPTTAQLQALADDVVAGWQSQMHLDPEARGVLERLGERHRLALVTNFDHPRHVHGLLDEWQVRDLFDTIVVSGDAGVTKPDPAIFGVALEGTGLQPGEVVHVGDSPEDVEGARAAGVTPILIRRPRDGDKPIILDYAASGDDDHDAEYHRDFGDVVTVSSLPSLMELLDG
jgi:HAD superfamily hydrolase (TIGR01509 family)